jgi:hypothetical protein
MGLFELLSLSLSPLLMNKQAALAWVFFTTPNSWSNLSRTRASCEPSAWNERWNHRRWRLTLQRKGAACLTRLVFLSERGHERSIRPGAPSVGSTFIIGHDRWLHIGAECKNFAPKLKRWDQRTFLLHNSGAKQRPTSQCSLLGKEYVPFLALANPM